MSMVLSAIDFWRTFDRVFTNTVELSNLLCDLTGFRTLVSLKVNILTCFNVVFHETMVVTVDVNPAEQNFKEELQRATAIVVKLMQTSSDVNDLIQQLRQAPSLSERPAIEGRLCNVFEAALRQEGVPPGIVHELAQFLAHNADVSR